MDMQTDARTRPLTMRQVQAWVESGDPRSVIDVTVTPEIARLLLRYNRPGDTNRPVSDVYVAAAVGEIEKGLWQNTGEPIIMSKAAILNDGQHRLEAIIRSKIPCVMDLRFGVSRAAFAATNSGRKRSGADALGLLGVPERHALAAAARGAIVYQQGLPAAMYQRTSNGDIVRAVEQWPELVEAVKLTPTLGRGRRSAATNTLAFFALRTANRASVEEFFAIVKTGEGNASNPPHRLHEFLLARHVTPDSTTHRIRCLAAGIIAWNAWRKAETLPRPIDWHTRRPFPVVDGLTL